jgi:hypothetical protein
MEDSEKGRDVNGSERRPQATDHAYQLFRVALFFPQVVGLAIIGAVLTGNVANEVLHSGGAISTALLVGAILIVAPLAIFVMDQNGYKAYLDFLNKKWRITGPSADTLEPRLPQAEDSQQ